MENNMLKLDGMEKIEQNPADKLAYLPSKGRLTTEREEAKRNRQSKFDFFSLPKDATIRFLPDAAGPMITSKNYMDRYVDLYQIDDNPRAIMPLYDTSGSMSAKITETGKEALSKIIDDYMEQMKGMKSLYYIRSPKPAPIITVDSLSMVTEDMKTYREHEEASDALRMNILKQRKQEMDTGFFYAPYIPDVYSKNEYKVVEPLGSTDTLSPQVFTGDLDISSMYGRLETLVAAENEFAKSLFTENLCQEIPLTTAPSKGINFTFDLEANIEDWAMESFFQMPKSITTGNDALDILFGGGLKPGTVTMIAGQAGLGKSALAKSVAAGLSVNGTEFLYVTAEQSSEAIVERIQALNLYNTDTGYKVVQAGDWSLNGLVNLIREETEDLDNPRVVFIDELSFFKDAGSHVLGRQLRTLAMELDVAIVGMNQLARAAKYDTMPTLPSGDYGLLNEVDVAIAITRNGTDTELSNMKNRHGNANAKFLFDAHRNLIWEPLKVATECADDNMITMECTFGDQSKGRGSRVTELPGGNVEVMELADLEFFQNKLQKGLKLPIKSQLIPFANLKAAFAPKVEDSYPVADWL